MWIASHSQSEDDFMLMYAAIPRVMMHPYPPYPPYPPLSSDFSYKVTGAPANINSDANPAQFAMHNIAGYHMVWV